MTAVSTGHGRGHRPLLVLFALLLVGGAASARPCEQAAGGKPCPDNDIGTLTSYLRQSEGANRHSYNLAMDEAAYIRQQDYQPPVELEPIPVALRLPTPGPTPAGMPYWKACTHVTCDYIDGRGREDDAVDSQRACVSGCVSVACLIPSPRLLFLPLVCRSFSRVCHPQDHHVTVYHR